MSADVPAYDVAAVTPSDVPTEQYLWCPFCTHTEWVSDEDPAASFSQILRHIDRSHPRADQTPAKLWPRIKVIPVDEVSHDD